MTHTTLNANDSGPTSRAVINANFAANDVSIDSKVAYSGTVPAVGDLVVAAATDGLSIKKKVFTASQTLESDSNGQPTSAAKGTAYNVNFGTSALTALEGNNDALYMKLAGTQTVTGDKVFSGALTIPSVTIATTQSLTDSSTKVATTAFVQGNTGNFKSGVFTKDMTEADGATTVIAHGMGITPKRVFMSSRIGSASFVTATSDGGFTASGNSCVFTGANNSADRSATSTTYGIYIVGTNATLVSQAGIITVDATNITITWTKTNSPTGSAFVRWEANV